MANHDECPGSKSTDCHGGIFAERSKAEVDLLPIKLSSSCPCDGCTVFARPHRGRSYPFVSHSAEPARVLRKGLYSRGWTLQERLLPPRILHFTPTEIAWECSREVSCECRLHGSVPGQYLIFRRAFVNSIPTQHSGPADHRDLLRQAHGPLYNEARGDLTGIVQLHWNLIIFEFTARAPTFETDQSKDVSAARRRRLWRVLDIQQVQRHERIPSGSPR